jgi:hypothetical protein
VATNCNDSLNFAGRKRRRIVKDLLPALQAEFMRRLIALAALVACCGCQQGPFPIVGRPAALEHWFPFAHQYAPHGRNTHARPPCPYFDPPPRHGEYVFCEDCGVYHVVKDR